MPRTPGKTLKKLKKFNQNGCSKFSDPYHTCTEHCRTIVNRALVPPTSIPSNIHSNQSDIERAMQLSLIEFQKGSKQAILDDQFKAQLNAVIQASLEEERQKYIIPNHSEADLNSLILSVWQNSTQSTCVDLSKLKLIPLAVSLISDEFTIKESITFLDPLSLSRIETPVKGLKCPHRQCFDLRNSLVCSDTLKSVNCSCCGNNIKVDELRVCGWFQQMLKKYPDHENIYVDGCGKDWIEDCKNEAEFVD